MSGARHLIVNADDLGASPGITRGILEAHTRGIVTSASLMVETAHSAAAASAARALPTLSVGLHVVLEPGVDVAGVAGEIERQLERFEALMGGPPTHLDSHHDTHLDPRVLPAFLELARGRSLPLRGHSAARRFSGFYGRWSGESHPEHVGIESLGRMLREEVGAGITELTCHPGYAEVDLMSDYRLEREAEQSTLCDPRTRAMLDALVITLVGFRDLARLVTANGGVA
jgi:predicted glycoside hydrolase/deacetylase ChbG (UPF0249 family)